MIVESAEAVVQTCVKLPAPMRFSEICCNRGTDTLRASSNTALPNMGPFNTLNAVKILVCEDEAEVASFVRDALVETGYEVDCAADGKVGLDRLLTNTYDAAILDLMLPSIEGLEVLRLARARGVQTPILILSARFRVEERIEGLDSGANDYLVKPFALGELLARIRVLLRHAAPIPLKACGVELDPSSRKVTFANKVVFLSSTEFSLLHLLMKNEGRVLSRSDILTAVWDDPGHRASNVVDVYINYLRSKLDPSLIQTIRGSGYVFGNHEEV